MWYFVQFCPGWSTRYRDHFRGVHSDASPALLCHKEPAQGTQSPLLGAFLPFAGSLRHKDKWLHAQKESINYLDIEWTPLNISTELLTF